MRKQTTCDILLHVSNCQCISLVMQFCITVVLSINKNRFTLKKKLKKNEREGNEKMKRSKEQAHGKNKTLGL